MARAAILQPKPAARSAPVQAKLNVGPVGDRFEQEADRVASRIGSSSTTAAAPPPTISGLSVQRVAAPPAPGPEKQDEDVTPPEKRAQRKAKAAPKKEDKKSAPRAQRKAAAKSKKTDDRPQKKTVAQGERTTAQVGAQGGPVPADVDTSIQRMRKRPAPGLDPTTRARVENAVGSDLGGVRVHTDAAAADAANALGARAFTVGQDMFFGQGQYGTQSTEGQRLIAHEAAHTVQQGGGSAGAQRVQRAGGDAKSESQVKPDANAATSTTKKLEGTGWSVEIDKTAESEGVVTVPELKLPEILDGLKGTSNHPKLKAASITGKLPKKGESFTRPPISDRKERQKKAPFQKWVEYARKNFSPGLETLLKTQLEAQADAAPISDQGDVKVYVVKRAKVKATTSEFLAIGTIPELARHDAVVRPMLKKSGAHDEVDADHILEDQLGGLDEAENMWLLDSSYNRSLGPQIDDKIDKTLTSVRDKAVAEQKAQEAKGVKLDGKLPDDNLAIRRRWTIVFTTVDKGTFSGQAKSYWTPDEVKLGAHLKFYQALGEEEMFEQGFKFEKGKPFKPTRINVFPEKDGGRPFAFPVSSDGKTLRTPGHFFRGIEVLKILSFTPPSADSIGQVITKIQVRYEKKEDRSKKNSPMLKAEGPITIQHHPHLGYGGYVTRESIVSTFSESDFGPLSPISFPDVAISSDGELLATGQILSSKELLPGLQIPIMLRGTDVLVSFPIPTEKLSFGPVSVTDAAIDLGVGKNGFFMAGSATILVKDIGQGKISARVEKDDVIIAGDFMLDLDFLNPAKIAVVYSLAKDDFNAKATLGVQKGKLPGVDSGQVDIEVTRHTFGLTGTLNLGGILAGSTITVGYTPETGLLIEGRDLPLPVEKLPGVSDAKVTVRAQRNPDSGEWSVSGGGKASLSAGGAHGTLDIMFDGIAVTFTGRVDVAKGPATGWLQITGTNRAIDDEGKPIEGGPVGDLHIWGKGEATIAFGKILTGKAGIEYTPDGRVIISGEIALPPTYDLFPKKDLSPKEPLFSVNPPDFPIWGVKVGPVGFGIFAFVDASIRLEAYVGPGQLRDTKVQATIDLDKPEEATVHGQAQFYVPAYAGLRLDVGGGVKAQVAVAYVKGRVGLYGTLGLLVEGSFDVGVDWNPSDGFAVGAEAKIVASPKFELGVTASITAGVDVGLFDIDKTWGPWEKTLGEFGPNMQLGASFPMKWSEKDGLDFDTDDIKIQKPTIDAKEIMKGAFDMLV